MIWDTKHDLRCPVKSRLDICVNLLIEKTAGAEVYDFQTRTVTGFEENVLGFEIAVDDFMLADEPKGLEDLDRKSSN